MRLISYSVAMITTLLVSCDYTATIDSPGLGIENKSLFLTKN